MRKTKIVCTLGPATSSKEMIRQLIEAGMSVARFNFSHGTYEEHLARYDIVSALREEMGLSVATLLDTKGPEIRLCQFEGGQAELKAGDHFTLTTDETIGDQKIAQITYAKLPQDVYPGCRILLDDGLIELAVTAVDQNNIICTVVNGGVIKDKKGVNLPGITLSMPYISEKDRADILFAVEHDFDFIAASFVRSAEDVLAVRDILERHKGGHIRIIAKIENAQGVANIDEILRVADGLMIARGDMGVEIPLEDVPVLQKLLIKKVYNCGKMVITATQMLESMIQNPRPTRAEATDVANAIYDGTSAIMLSGETAAGAHPVEAVRTMAIIAARAERDINYRQRFIKRDSSDLPDVTNAISHATCTTAYDLNATAIIPISKSGNTARMVSKYRPDIPIIACTFDPVSYRQLSLSWGVLPLLIEKVDNTDTLFTKAVDAAVKAGLLQSGDLVVITAGIPLGISGTTNLLKVHIVGDVLVSGRGTGAGTVVGNLCVETNEKSTLESFKPGDILVTKHTDNDMMPILKQCAGIITEQDGLTSHAAVVGMSLGIPVIVGASNATLILKSGTAVTVDSSRGIVTTSSSRP